MPSHMENSLIFHYNLKFYGNDKDSYEGVSLKRCANATFKGIFIDRVPWLGSAQIHSYEL